MYLNERIAIVSPRAMPTTGYSRTKTGKRCSGFLDLLAKEVSLVVVVLVNLAVPHHGETEHVGEESSTEGNIVARIGVHRT